VWRSEVLDCRSFTCVRPRADIAACLGACLGAEDQLLQSSMGDNVSTSVIRAELVWASPGHGIPRSHSSATIVCDAAIYKTPWHDQKAIVIGGMSFT